MIPTTIVREPMRRMTRVTCTECREIVALVSDRLRREDVALAQAILRHAHHSRAAHCTQDVQILHEDHPTRPERASQTIEATVVPLGPKTRESASPRTRLKRRTDARATTPADIARNILATELDRLNTEYDSAVTCLACEEGCCRNHKGGGWSL